MQTRPAQRSLVPPPVRLLAGLAAAVAMTVGLISCGSDDSKPSTTASPAFSRLDPEQFAAGMGNAAQVINVHVPYEGELEHTDAFIPFDRILGDDRLTADKSSEVFLYCKSGRMSEIAGNALNQAGYTNVSHLEGGMQAWEAAGKPLLHTQNETPTGTH